MKHKEYHYRVNSIKKQIDNLRQINEEQHFIIHELQRGLNATTLECANIKTELVKVQNALTNNLLLGDFKKIIKEGKSE